MFNVLLVISTDVPCSSSQEMDIWYNLLLVDHDAEFLTEVFGESRQDCMDSCIKNKHCTSFIFDKRPDRRTHCRTWKSHQFGQYYKSKGENGGKKHPEFWVDEGYDSGMLCAFEAHNKPTRQPDNKYTLDGKFKHFKNTSS